MLGLALKTKRVSKKITQQEMADFLNITQKTYSNIENGKTKISFEKLVLICKFLRFNLCKFCPNQTKDSLLGGTSNSNVLPEAYLSRELVLQFKKQLKEKDRLIAVLERQAKDFQNLD